MHIYVDVLFFLNLCMNTIILASTGQAAGLTWSWYRVILAAVLGSLYAVGMVVAELSALYTPPAKTVFSALFVALAFGFKSLRFFLFVWSLFFIISFILGGAVLGWLFFTESDILYPGSVWSVSWLHLVGGSVVALILLGLIARTLLAKISRKGVVYPISIHYQGRTARLEAMLDTGNRLTSPLSGRPVIVAEREALAPLFSSDIAEFLANVDSHLWLSEIASCRDTDWLARIEPIPFQGLGARSMLLGFRPDNVMIEVARERVAAGNVLIGVYSRSLAPDGAYQALLHPRVLEDRDYMRRRESAR